MEKIIRVDEWSDFISKFNKNNIARPTRLQEFDKMGAQTVEHGMAFNGLDLLTKGEDAPCIEIVLGGEKEGSKHLTHRVSNVTQVALKLDDAGKEEVLEIENETGDKLLLNFESFTEIENI